MKKFSFVIFFLLLLFGAFLAGSWHSGRENAKGSTSAGRQISEKEDAAKTKMASEEGPASQDSGDTASMPLGTVKVSNERQQIIGVSMARVEKRPVKHMIRIFGRVAVDETRVYRLIAPLDGWIVEAFDNSTGSLVKKDEPLASFYGQDVLTAEVTYFQALTASRTFSTSSTRRALDGLKAIGMPDVQIKELERTREYAVNVLITAPFESFVISRNVSPGQRFDKGTEWYRLADLSRVWILADLFENESHYFKPGAHVKITLPYQRKAFQATVSKILPQFDAASRTLKVRLETDNPGFILRPDMFVDVELPVSLPACIFVPADAVLDSGLRKTVFVDRGNGFFEPRRVETGWRMGGQIEILKGLRSGERIVVSGNFLIDSESRMELAAAGIYGTMNKDPVCGMDVDEKRAKASGRRSEYRGVTYYFCTDECKEKFDENPDRYIGKMSEDLSHPAAGHGSRPTTHPKNAGENRD
jgi:Cu(I)/Ag(I) efflux system membrane fusion protein